MQKVDIYTTAICPFCADAKKLLDKKGIKYHEISVDKDEAKRDEMIKLSGGSKSVPQIFINGKHIGGFDKLSELERSGELDTLLKGE